MNIKHIDIEIPEDKPFQNCKLKREHYADVLTDIINAFPEGFVLAINNEWGTGKTTFVKMWQQQLNNKGFKTLYFNAWENDFDSAPLVAIMSELKQIAPKQKLPKKLLEHGAILTKHILPGLIKAAAEKYIDTKVFTESIENVLSAATEILEKEVDEFNNKKKQLEDFKTVLCEFVKKQGNDNPVIFIIDELDRCKPDYAVETLEKIKHFFSVEGIVFILSLDKKQLANSVRGYYGSDLIDADEYLRRIIDIEYSIPAPDINLFTRYLYDYYDFNSFFTSDQRWKYSELQQDRSQFLEFANELFIENNLSLRQQIKIFSHSRIVIKSFKSESYIFPELLIFLVFLRIIHQNIYFKIQNKQFRNLQELIDEIEPNLPVLHLRDNRFSLMVEARLICMYNSFYSRESKLFLSNKETPEEKELAFKSGIDDTENNREFRTCIDWVLNERTNSIKLDYLLNKIDLIEMMVN